MHNSIGIRTGKQPFSFGSLKRKENEKMKQAHPFFNCANLTEQTRSSETRAAGILPEPDHGQAEALSAARASGFSTNVCITPLPFTGTSPRGWNIACCFAGSWDQVSADACMKQQFRCTKLCGNVQSPLS